MKVKRFGYTRKNKQRWRCLECKKTYQWKNTQNSFLRSKSYFKRWLSGATISDLAERKHVSEKSMRRLIRAWLEVWPEDHGDLSQTRYIVVDGTFLEGRKEPVILVLDALTHCPIFWRYGANESMRDLSVFFLSMKEAGCEPTAATVDGNPALARALLLVWPNILIQRCIVHVQRQGLMWCRRHPKRRDAFHLRKLFISLTKVASWADASVFLERWNQWEDRYGKRLEQEKSRGWVQSDLKRAQSMIQKSIPHLFLFLDDPNIPHTTNIAEGCISRLKGLLTDHRGLRFQDRKSLVHSFLSYRN